MISPKHRLNVPQLIHLALDHHKAGRFAEAESLYRQALVIDPKSFDALHLLGVLMHHAGNNLMAVELIGKALKQNTSSPFAHNHMGEAYRMLGRFSEAKKCYQKALAIKPDLDTAHNNLGLVHKELGNLKDAEACYRRALAINPGMVEAYNNLGIVCHERGRPDEAEECYRKALAINPAFIGACNNLGIVCHECGKLDEAEACYRKALAINPDLAETCNNLGSVLQERGLDEEAEACCRKALELDPNLAQAHSILASLLHKRGRRDEAFAHSRQAVALNPENHVARADLTHQLQNRCEWGELESNTLKIRQAVQQHQAAAGNRISPFSFLALSGTTAEEQKHCAEQWAQHEYRHKHPLLKKRDFDSKRPANEKIAIGYLSADFCNHATAHLMASIFELHGRSRFHVTAYSYSPDDGSAMQARLKKAFDRFVDISGLTDEQAAGRICDDHIDILVDLKGYTEGSRSAILALRPAPIQVNFLGYPGTMGAKFVDYLIADRFIIPPELQTHYTEKIAYLPDCYQPNDSARPLPAAPDRQACGLPEKGIVFCCFNQTYKITPDVFDIWCRLLKAVPGSLLWLLASNPYAEANLKREAQNRGVEADRLVMAPWVSSAEHLARLQCADLFLDTFPVNAHTTCSDALWVGVPVITCAGEAFASRVAGSLLSTIGAPELIAYNLEDYYTLALDFATDHAKRENIRSRIIAARNTSPLFDSERFTRNLEIVYARMREENQENMKSGE